MNHNQLIVDDYHWPMGHPKALIPHGKTLGKPTPFHRLLMDQILSCHNGKIFIQIVVLALF
jgi:hypothetical protein